MPRKVIDNKKKKERITKKKLETDVYDLKGQLVGKISLPDEIFAAKINPVLLTQAVRVYQINQRAGTHASKTRAQVSGSTRKIYRQKGTGRARHGDIKAPIFIGGGVAHGPKNQDFKLNFSKKMKKLALYSALTAKLQEDKIKILSGLETLSLKTKNMFNALKNLGLTTSDGLVFSRTLLVLSDNNKNIILSGRNLENLDIRQVRQLNTFDILAHQNILFMEKSIQVLTDNLIRKEKQEKSEVNIDQSNKTKNINKDKESQKEKKPTQRQLSKKKEVSKSARKKEKILKRK